MLGNCSPARATGRVALTAILGTAALLSAVGAHAQANDPVIFSFASVGDSRQDPTAPDPTTLLSVSPTTGAGVTSNTGALLPQDAQWLQNSKAWTRIVRTVQTEKINMLMFNGDMVMGYGRPAWSTTAPPTTVTGVANSDLVRFYTQYAYWRGSIANLFEMGTYVIPIPGNHETECNSVVSTNPADVACASGKHAYAENEDAYRANMGDLINDLVTNVRFSNVTGFPAQNVAGLTQASAPGAADGATSTQAQLSYSFDISSGAGLLHFAIVNTDPTGNDSHAPTTWLANDLASAKTRGAVKYFVFGHKPAFTYNYNAISNGTVAAGGLDVDTVARNNFWSVIAQYGATYFCGHEHTVHIDQHADPTSVHPGTPYQVIVGSGGSPFDDKLIGTCPSCTEPVVSAFSDRYYAWAVVRVHQSGLVTLDAYGFNDTFGPTQTVASLSGLQ